MLLLEWEKFLRKNESETKVVTRHNFFLIATLPLFPFHPWHDSMYDDDSDDDLDDYDKKERNREKMQGREEERNRKKKKQAHKSSW